MNSSFGSSFLFLFFLLTRAYRPLRIFSSVQRLSWVGLNRDSETVQGVGPVCWPVQER